jgi:hypothetical protein
VRHYPSRLTATCLFVLVLLLPQGITATHANLLTPSASPTDLDNDGVPNSLEVAGDTDGDGIQNANDPDDDGDGIPTLFEDLDSDNNLFDNDDDSDGKPNFLDADDDGDGVSTADETDHGTDIHRNTDGDGRRDYLDSDDDGDGILTFAETAGGTNITLDTDGDGIWDYLDAQIIPPSADLAALSISAGALFPSFSPGTTGYTLTQVIADGVSDVTVKAQPGGNGSPTMQASINGEPFAPLNSNQASSPLQLIGCANVVTVQVTNGPSVKEYTINITRANCTQGPQGPQGETGLTGPEGPQGPQGVQGPAGISGLQHVTGSPVTISRGSSETVTATCPSGKTVIGGGFKTGVPPGSAARPEAMIVFSSAGDGTSGWSVSGANTTSRNDGNATLTLTAYAICAIVAQ